MVFSKDTTFLNLVRGERDHENYGITHTIKHMLHKQWVENPSDIYDALNILLCNISYYKTVL